MTILSMWKQTRMQDAVATVTYMIQNMWAEAEYRLDIGRATRGAHTAI